MKLGLPVGISTGFWFIIGCIRSFSESFFVRSKKISLKSKNKPKLSDIAVLVPAHNEEKVITQCIRALTYSLKPEQIYIASDGSTDNTYMLAKQEGCNVIGFVPGQGKARALVALIEKFNLYKRYKLIMIVDADTQVDKQFFKRALPYFHDPEVAVLFPSSRIHWQQHILPRLPFYFIAYRERLNRMLQFFLMYGQTWKYTNVSYVIPGFATIYRTDVLKQLRIDTPGLLIEDFNLAFQFHKKKLGKIVWDPGIIGWDQFPDNLPDYWKQVRRWNIGFFQTVRRNGIWPSWFWLSLGIFTIEVVLNALFTLLLPVIILVKLIPYIHGLAPDIQHIARSVDSLTYFHSLTLPGIFLLVFLFDYGMTVWYGIMGRKPQFIIYGLFFFFMHYVTSLILFSSIIPGFFKSSDGRWISPKRLTD